MKFKLRLFIVQATSRMLDAVAGDPFGREPWLFSKNSNALDRLAQKLRQRLLSLKGKCSFSRNVYISSRATISPRYLRIGENSVIGSETQVGYDIKIGADCTINAGAIVRGKVRLGNEVRVASGAQILGFNHTFDDLLRPVYKQPIERQGIEIGDDVWIGANAIVVDGVEIGSHSIVGAGSIVTRSVQEWSVVAGNPAKIIRSRLTDANLRNLYEDFTHKLSRDIPAILQNHRDADGFKAVPGVGGKARAWTDSIELAAMVDQNLLDYESRDLIKKLQAFQDPETGLAQGPYGEGKLHKGGKYVDMLECAHSAYMTMATGYALECLGSSLMYPVYVVDQIVEKKLFDYLDRLPWATNAWQAGAWVDHFASACYFNARYFGSRNAISSLFSWLEQHIDAHSGVWGDPYPEGDWSQPVNGFYRLTRGTYAQYGKSLQMPNQAIDTILNHSENSKYFSPRSTTACHVLDIMQPLWLCLKETEHRQEEIMDLARKWLVRTIQRWDSERGLSFATEENAQPSVKGTEMWLSIIWYCADTLKLNASCTHFSPKGIHRPEAVWAIR